ncbi:MAG: aminodeoxychorismate/anthranilate synthase component II [Myxococcales bacterium]|nr:aminodeoxychorismate/anthranilate synthase component II [Myxococcales bacterium]
MRLQPSGAARRARPGCRVVVIDNYDSFTFNLVQYLLELGATVDIYRNDAVTAEAVLADRPSHALLSPGPGAPADSGVCQALCRALGPAGVPTLGVCLGHQTLCEVHGARVERAARVMHGKLSPVIHDGAGLFAELPSPLQATRYHSLIVAEETLPPALIATARTDHGELMAVRHRDYPLCGVQFHPESIRSEHGHALLENFLNMSSGAGKDARPG